MFFSHFKASKATIIYYGERQKHRFICLTGLRHFGSSFINLRMRLGEK